MIVKEVPLPENSLCINYLKSVDYHDSFEGKIHDETRNAQELYLKIFSYIPTWAMALLHVRNQLVKLVGIKTEASNGAPKTLEVGKRAGMFFIYDIQEDELIAGEDNMHLDFRLSVFKEDHKVTISTLVHYHNILGKMYFFVVKPFHKLIVKSMLKHAIKGERI